MCARSFAVKRTFSRYLLLRQPSRDRQRRERPPSAVRHGHGHAWRMGPWAWPMRWRETAAPHGTTYFGRVTALTPHPRNIKQACATVPQGASEIVPEHACLDCASVAHSARLRCRSSSSPVDYAADLASCPWHRSGAAHHAKDGAEKHGARSNCDHEEERGTDIARSISIYVFWRGCRRSTRVCHCAVDRLVANAENLAECGVECVARVGGATARVGHGASERGPASLERRLKKDVVPTTL